MLRAVGALFLAAILLPATQISIPNQKASPAQDLALPSQVSSKIYEERYQLLLNCVFEQGKGLTVVSVDPNGPGANMRLSGDSTSKGILDPKNVITHINRQPITSLDHFHTALAKVQGNASITVYDPAKQRAAEWDVKASKAMAPAAATKDPRSEKRVIHAVLVGDTNDQEIGKAAKMNIENIAAVLKKEIPEDFLRIYILTGERCTAKEIVNQIQAINSKPSDTIFYFHTCHGGYDPRYEKNDPSGGHFFQLPNGDLLRKTLFENIMTRPCRLRVVYTESCNFIAFAHPAQLQMANEMVITKKARPLEQLLRYHNGYVDLNAASRDQSAWVSSKIGGWFTYVTLNTIQSENQWDTFIYKLSQETSSFYKKMRDSSLNDATKKGFLDRDPFQKLKNQPDMTPIVYRLQLTRDTEIEERPEIVINGNWYSVVDPN